MHPNRPGLAALGAFALTWSTDAFALEVGQLGDEAVRVEVTDATSLLYNSDNRNSRLADVSRQTDDFWGLWYNRLNVQANWKTWQAGLRLDSALFYERRDPSDVALTLLEARNGGTLPDPIEPDDADFFLAMLGQADRELSNRFINWVYPAKYYVGYTTPDVEVTAGDFNAQLGRGLVLSVRKLDELSNDTTIRGGRVTGRIRSGKLRLKLTGLGGTANPLRIDEASGRYISTDASVYNGIAPVTEAGMPRPVESALDDNPAATYAPDHIIGAQIEGGTRQVMVGAQGSFLQRSLIDENGNGIEEDALTPGAIRSADGIGTGSVSVNLPDLDDHGTAYVEVAVQDLMYPPSLGEVERTVEGAGLPDTGYAVYAAASIIEHPVIVTLEGKHYRRFFPLQANIDISRSREFGAVQYNTPPTTEAFWIDTEFEGFNTCVSGGRARGDVAVGKDESLFAWVGHYLSWNESVTNEQCVIDSENLNRVWDAATGFEITGHRRKSRANSLVGARFDHTDREITDSFGFDTRLFYREVYTRYDVIQWLTGPFALQLQGWHRRRQQTLGGPNEPWFEGQHQTALQWSPHITAGFGVEYDMNPQFPDTYFNGFAKYNIDSGSNVGVFVGQRRGGLRCVSGVCRIFPPFEGARIDATFRF